MTVAHDASSEILKTADAVSSSQTHTPVGTPRGIVVTIARANPGNTVLDYFTSVTYGGVEMQRIVNVNDTSGEHGQACAYFLGSSIPAGPQTWTVTYSSFSQHDLQCLCSSVTANADTEVVDFDSIGADTASPQVTLQYDGHTCISYASLYSGNASAPTVLGTCTHLGSSPWAMADGTYWGSACRQTTPATSDFTIGWTQTSDDAALAAIAIRESDIPPPPTNPLDTVAPFVRVTTA